jgi:hypothetical protein
LIELVVGMTGEKNIDEKVKEVLAERQGLTADTAPHGHFMKGYTDARIERGRTHKRQSDASPA